ncbi:MAG: hypothetical protein GF309_09525 [Candidatus Lokiarchaeota archaeon]|nr:hypothetical protein [Candidatus Lokiarchaeota archaeon]
MMSDLDRLQEVFTVFLDGLWWGLRDNVGALSMYEGYSNGFRLIGVQAAQDQGVKGVEEATALAANIMKAIGLNLEVEGSEIRVDSCPIWDRIKEQGLEYSFHIEEICWKPLLEAIAEEAGVKAFVDSSLRQIHVKRGKIEYKRSKLQRKLEEGSIAQKEHDEALAQLDKQLDSIPEKGRYRFA